MPFTERYPNAMGDYLFRRENCWKCELWNPAHDCCTVTACVKIGSWTYILPAKKGVEKTMNNVEEHNRVLKELNSLYAIKNADYKDSFHDSYVDWGLPMAAIRLGDKYNRFRNLVKTGEAAVKSESLRDTLIDLANYAVMTVMELDREACQNGRTERESERTEETGTA